MVSVLGPLFRTAGHQVRTHFGVTTSAGQRRGDVVLRNYIRDQGGSRSLVFDLAVTDSCSVVAPQCTLLHALPVLSPSSIHRITLSPAFTSA